MIRYVIVFGLATPAFADPMFENYNSHIPPHTYAGGWEHFVGGGVAAFDCNGDALPELFLAGGEEPALFLGNDGGFAFSPLPFPDISRTTGAYPLDINGDGYLDLYVMRAAPDIVLRGGPNCTFTDMTADLGLTPTDQWTTSFTAWWDGDGRPTMAVGHYVDRTNPDGPFGACDTNLILWPDGEKYRQEVLEPGFCALSMLAAFDARGRKTLRISNDRHYYVHDGYEQMWDIGEQRFLTEEDGWKHVSLWGMGIASRDLTGDGRDEVMLTSMADQLLQIAQPDGTYAPAPFTIGTYAHRPYQGDDGRPSTGWHAQFGDVDNDGRPDLFIAKGNVDQMASNAIHDPNNLLMQQADGTFVEMAPQAGVNTDERSRGAALADLDNDGRLDLVVVNRRAPVELYRNVTEGTGHWLAVDLGQSGGNRNAIGAVVVVNGQSQQTTVGGGHAGGQAVPLHFGLGDAKTATISATWPDGSRQDLTAQVDQTVTIRKTAP